VISEQVFRIGARCGRSHRERAEVKIPTLSQRTRQGWGIHRTDDSKRGWKCLAGVVIALAGKGSFDCAQDDRV
jgi:hypothetical protein